jgi:hypothetical protein
VALYDQRLFKYENRWWAAEIHSGTGGGFVPHPQITRERVYFTCLSEEDRKTVTATIPAGSLNALKHRSLVSLLEKSEPIDGRVDMHPYNPPDRDEFRGVEITYDDEGLRWVFKKTSVVRVGPQGSERLPAIRLICLDDSALQDDVLLQSSATYEEIIATWGDEGKRALVGSVKQGFRDLTSEDC